MLWILTGNPETILFIIYLINSQVKIDERRPNLLGSRFLEGFQAYSGILSYFTWLIVSKHWLCFRGLRRRRRGEREVEEVICLSVNICVFRFKFIIYLQTTYIERQIQGVPNTGSTKYREYQIQGVQNTGSTKKYKNFGD